MNSDLESMAVTGETKMKNYAYALGRGDYSDGKTMGCNRFKVSSPLYKEWERGWMDAVRADPLLDEDEKLELLGEEPAPPSPKPSAPN